MIPATIDHHSHDGAPPWERPRSVPEIAEDVATTRVLVKIEQLASTIPGERLTAERWMADHTEEPGGIEWCSYVLGAAPSAVVQAIRARAAELRERRRAHRASIRVAHNPRQPELLP